MLAVHLINGTNRFRYADELDQHHRLRHDIYIGEKGCRSLVGRDGREIDPFDTDAATYLLATTPGRVVVGGTRLLPSTGPTPLSELFPHLADIRGFERAPDILEWSRFFTAPAFPTGDRTRQAAGQLGVAMMAYCLEEGIRHLNAVGETFWMPRISMLGWRPRPLGLAVEHDGMSICAWTIEVSLYALRTTCEHYGIPAARLVRSGPRLPDRARRARSTRRVAA